MNPIRGLSVVIIHPNTAADITSGGLAPLAAVMKSANAGQCGVQDGRYLGVLTDMITGEQSERITTALAPLM